MQALPEKTFARSLCLSLSLPVCLHACLSPIDFQRQGCLWASVRLRRFHSGVEAEALRMDRSSAHLALEAEPSHRKYSGIDTVRECKGFVVTICLKSPAEPRSSVRC